MNIYQTNRLCMSIRLIWSNNSNGNRTLKWYKTYCKNTIMELYYTVQSDNTLMAFGLWLNLKITKDSLGQLGSEVVIEPNKLTRKSTCFESINLR